LSPPAFLLEDSSQGLPSVVNAHGAPPEGLLVVRPETEDEGEVD
jgi:hypothetical protein